MPRLVIAPRQRSQFVVRISNWARSNDAGLAGYGLVPILAVMLLLAGRPALQDWASPPTQIATRSPDVPTKPLDQPVRIGPLPTPAIARPQNSPIPDISRLDRAAPLPDLAPSVPDAGMRRLETAQLTPIEPLPTPHLDRHEPQPAPLSTPPDRVPITQTAPPSPSVCMAPAQFALDARRASLPPSRPAPDDGQPFGVQLARAAVAQSTDTVIYNPRYSRIAYPRGDVSPLFGVCTDVVIRAYREVGVDLQDLVHRTGRGGDPSIAHRRTETLRGYFARFGEQLAITDFSEDYLPGDVVTYFRPQNRTTTAHIAIVSERIAPSGRRMIVHNRGWGPQLEDALFVDKITGHYRYSGPQEAGAIAMSDAGVRRVPGRSMLIASSKGPQPQRVLRTVSVVKAAPTVPLLPPTR